MNQSRSLPRKIFLAAAALFSCALMAGCGRSGSAKNIVSGTVTVNGQPAAGATLTLNYPDGNTYPIVIDKDGAFKVGQVPLGKATVTFSISTFGARARQMIKGSTDPRVQKMLTQTVVIPEKYTKKATSDLTWEITAGTNEKEFELKE